MYVLAKPPLSFVAPRLSRTHVQTLHLLRTERTDRAGFCVTRASLPELASERGSYLHADEQAYFTTLSFERRQHSYLLGRYCAKHALGVLQPDASPTNFAIMPGVLEHPVVLGMSNVQVSISHAGAWGVAIAFPEAHPLAVDIECLDPKRLNVLRSQSTPAEVVLTSCGRMNELAALTLLWTMKEGLAKILRCGLTTPFRLFEIATVQPEGDGVMATFENFAQYKAVSFLLPDAAVSIVVPRETRFDPTTCVKELVSAGTNVPTR